MESRHEPVPQSKGQSASRPERLVTRLFCQAADVTFQLPQETGLSFCGVLPPSLRSSSVFPCWFPGSCPEAGGCAVATPAIRGVGRGGCAASPRGQRHHEHRAPTQEPRNFSGISPQYLVRSWVLPYLFTCGMSPVPSSTSRNFGK